MAKRVCDIAGAIVLLALLALPMLLVAGLVWWRLGRPVFFVQARSGWRGRPFRMIKFRTMRNVHDDTGALLPDAARLGSVGRLMRNTSLDELPELWNVVRGEMSLVGPRPLLPEYIGRYSPEQARRHEVRPGITGWAQVNGRNASSWPDRLSMDVWYVDHQSFLLDVRILFMTIVRVVSRRNVSHPVHDVMPPFTGTEDGRG